MRRRRAITRAGCVRRRGQGAGGRAQVVFSCTRTTVGQGTSSCGRATTICAPHPAHRALLQSNRLPNNVLRCGMRRVAALIVLLSAPALYGQWTFGTQRELRANYRDSKEAMRALALPFPPCFLPVGETTGFLETVNAGRHTELSVAQLRVHAHYEDWG